jgi:hypothetical protein
MAQTKCRSSLHSTFLPLVLIVIPVAVHLWFVRSFAVSLPFWDEWEFWWSMKGLDEGNWNFALWLPHNEHRLVISRLFYFLLRYTTGLDVTVAMYFNVLLACLTLWALWLHLRVSVQVSLWYFVPVAYVVFSLEQWENMLWGWQIAIYSMVCSSVWSLYWLTRPGMVKFGMAILAAIISSFSFANGLMIWPVGVVYLILARSGRKRLLLWCGAAAAILFLYFYKYVTQVTRPSPTQLVRPTSFSEFVEAPMNLLLHDPLSLPTMIFGNVGALLAPLDVQKAVLMGIVTVVVFLVSLYGLIRTRSAWATMPLSLVALGLLSFMSSLSIIGGRMGYWDTEFVLSSRYTTITLLGIVAAYLLAAAIANGPQMPNRNFRYTGMILCGIISLLLVSGLPAGYQVGLNRGQAWKAERAKQREIVQSFETQSDEELSTVYPKNLRERLVYWQSHHLVPFRR